MDARHMLEDAGLTPLRITEVQSTEDDEDVIVPMFLRDRGSYMTLSLFFFCLASSIMLSMYCVLSFINYVYAIFIK